MNRSIVGFNTVIAHCQLSDLYLFASWRADVDKKASEIAEEVIVDLRTPAVRIHPKLDPFRSASQVLSGVFRWNPRGGSRTVARWYTLSTDIGTILRSHWP